MSERIKYNFFDDGMRIFLNYIYRKLKIKPDYKPHPLITAFELALHGVEGAKPGEHFMGLAQNGTEENICNPFVVVLKKIDLGVEVQEIRNLKVNETVPVEIMLTIFRLQISLDRIEGDFVNPAQCVDSLNSVIPGNRFYNLSNRWLEAVNEFRKLLRLGKIHAFNKKTVEDAISCINSNMNWDEYPNNVRACIGQSIAAKDNMPTGTVIITSPENSKIEKIKIFDIVMEILLGKTSNYYTRGKT